MPRFEIEECPEFIEMVNARCLDLKKLDKGDKPKKSHWASEVFGPCMRKIFFTWLGLKPTNETDEVLANIFESGRVLEASVIEKIKLARLYIDEGEYVVIDPHRTDLELEITGVIDAKAEDENGLIVPVEIKETKDFGEDWDGDLWKKYLPKDSHVGQLICYLKAKNKPYGYLWYSNKNRHLEVGYKITLTDESWEDIIEFFKGVEKVLLDFENTEEFPEIPEDAQKAEGKKFPCSWYSKSKKDKDDPPRTGCCQYFDFCWNGGEEELKETVKDGKNLME